MNEKTDPQKMVLIAKLAFAPVYPYLAKQIKEKFYITEGTCLDLGTGPGSMAIAMANITSLEIIALDIQPEMIEICKNNIAEAGLSQRIRTVNANVCNIPLDDNSIDLIISRGSIFFWEDRITAFKEMYRLLRQGGVAYCGGGMGNEQIKKQISDAFDTNEAIRAEKEIWLKMMKRNLNKLTIDQLGDELMQAGIEGGVIEENAGLWVQFVKKL
jgi:ubiquinone/menaquinone biosynthesis C-methylase UbiE